MMNSNHSIETEMPRASEGVIAYISPELKAKLEKIAEKEDRSISWLVGRWIEDKITEYEKAERGDRHE